MANLLRTPASDSRHISLRRRLAFDVTKVSDDIGTALHGHGFSVDFSRS